LINRTILSLSLATAPGCSAIVAGSNFSVNATVGDPSSAGFDNTVISSLLIGAAAVDVTLLILAAMGEIDLGLALNERQLETDLARGEGPLISDLAHALALPEDEVPRLAAKLREHRDALVTAVRATPTDEDPAVGELASTRTANRLLALRAALERALSEDPALAARLTEARRTALVTDR
jgi:hypothetical protein